LNLKLFFIARAPTGAFKELEDHYSKLIRSYAEIEVKSIFGAQIEKAQKISPDQAREAYTRAYEPFASSGFTIALDEKGKRFDSIEFAKLIENRPKISFFVGGAYGFERKFVESCHASVSLSPLTLSHDLARAVLLEQIYRALAINHNQPYHK
jgi:23S rRNA (pseudouridine1915-N3)-methyltransferase